MNDLTQILRNFLDTDGQLTAFPAKRKMKIYCLFYLAQKFEKAHFKNDPVFPAIITSDGVTQLGMFLFAHAGILDRFDNAYFTMIKGNCCDSKFRGQVRHGYSKLRYEVNVREVVETDEHICVYFDASIFNDEIQIMQIDSYTLKISDAVT